MLSAFSLFGVFDRQCFTGFIWQAAQGYRFLGSTAHCSD